MERAVAINLKIPDNAAYTALVTLQRLGVPAARVERSEIVLAENEPDGPGFAKRIAGDETIFNPNKHRLTLLDAPKPREGEVWITERDGLRRTVGWMLFGSDGKPLSRELLADAAERLLHNPAIERATF